MKTLNFSQSSTKLFGNVFLLFAFMLCFLSTELRAQAPDCSKICYEYGTISTGGSICAGSAGAVPGNSTVTIRDDQGNSQTVKSKANGSFSTSVTNLVAPVGATVTIVVNGRSCTVKVKPPNSCGNFFCAQASPDNTRTVQTEILSMSLSGMDAFCGGNMDTAHELLKEAAKKMKEQQQMLNDFARLAKQLSDAGNAGGGGNAAGPDCSKICYDRGTVATGGPICGGQPGAVPPNSTVRIRDSRGNVTTTTANADGSFFTTCPNHVVRPGDQITIIVNGKRCQVRAQRPGGCNNAGNGGGNNDDTGDTGDPTIPGTGTGGNNDTGNPNNQGNTGAGGNAAGPDCSKICYDRGTVATGGPICGGQPGAVPPNSTVRIRDSRGNVTTTTANADGSFFTTCPNHVVRPGDQITIIVNGKRCRVRAQRPGGCNNNGNGGGNNGNSGDPSIPGGSGDTGNPNDQGNTGGTGDTGHFGELDCSKIIFDRGTVATGGPVIKGAPGAAPPNCQVEFHDAHGNTTSARTNPDGSFFAPCGNFDTQPGEEIMVIANGKTCVILAGAPAGGNNGNGAAAGPDCSKIRYSRGTVATGGPVVVGQKGAVPPNSTVQIRDSRGNVTTTTANADGSFRTTCPNHQVQVGNTVTIIVNGKSCRVRVQR